MLTVFVSDVVVTAVILNTTFIRALTSFARANTAVQYGCLEKTCFAQTDSANTMIKGMVV